MTEIALIGKKIGMTREFYKTGQSVPVTVLKVEKGRVQVGEVLQSNSFSSSAKTWSKWHKDLFLRISFAKYTSCIKVEIV